MLKRKSALGLLLLLAACGSSPSGVDQDAASGPCVLGESGGSCVLGACRLEVPPGALAGLTEVIVAESQAPEDIQSDVVANRICSLGPSSLAFSRPVTLHISIDENEIPEGFNANSLVAFRYETAPELLPDLVYLEATHFEILTSSAIQIGVTAFPAGHHVGDELGSDAFDEEDPLSYIQNLSSELFVGAFYDGTRFYLTNGGRVLIWNNGVPSDPTLPPDVILGKPDLSSSYDDPSASNIKTAKQVWSDGNRIVVTATNRTLIWNQIPTTNFAPADIVLGQDSFTSSEINAGGEVGPNTMWDPDGIASDGSTLFIADARNNRVLVWDSFPVLNNQPADHVIGQETLYQNQINGGAIRFQQARGVFFDDLRVAVTSTFTNGFADIIAGIPSTDNPSSEGTIGVPGVRKVTPTTFPLPGAMTAFGAAGFGMRDYLGVRASFWNSFPLAADVEPDFFLGKPDGLLGGYKLGGVSASTFSAKQRTPGLFANETLVVVPDGRRALIWRSPPTSSYAPADLVIGQPTTTTSDERIDYGGIGADTLAHPSALSVTAAVVAVADRSNNRVLLIDQDAVSEPIVLGQADHTSYMPNQDWKSPSAGTLSAPEGVFTDGVRLVVADAGNNRVLLWNTMPQNDNTPADVVIGQQSFASIAPNAGAGDSDGDGDSDASASTLHRPSGVWIQDDVLFVADTVNHRVLVYDPIPTTNGAAATAVLGQPDFAANTPNAGGQWTSPSPQGLAFPIALEFLDGGDLLVADQENNRIVGYSAPLITGMVASFALGQPDLTSNQLPNYLASTVQPGIELADSQLTATASSLRRPGAIAVTQDHVYVADSDNHRVVAYSLPLSFPTTASFVLGQEQADTRIENENGIGAHSLKNPAAVAAAGNTLWVADTDNHRVLTYEVGGAPPTAATSILGQVDMLGSGINASAEARGIMDYPTGSSWDGDLIWLADRDNHRVLAYALEDGTVRMVLGQADEGRNLVNAGSGPSASSLAKPTDVFSDGEVLIVADRMNHRVLVWNAIPTTVGQAADLVLGQENFSEVEPNRGNGVLSPSANSLFSPGAIHYDGTHLYVSDTSNNRVLIWNGLPTSNGQPADRVLCQATMTSNLGNRGEAAPNSKSCAWPTGLRVVEDTLYVADSLNNRVLAFPKDASSDSSARLVLGQPDFISRSPVAATGQPDAATMSQPSDLEYDGANLLIVDSGNNRVLLYTTKPTETGQRADAVLGQGTFTTNITGPDYNSLNQPTGITLVKQPFHSTRLIISDSRKDRLLFYEQLPRRDW